MADSDTAVVIDDDVEIRSLLRDVLRDAGFEVVEAAKGRDGVAAVAERQPVVVTLDVGLPDMDGYEALRRIRTVTDCYVLMLSGRDDEIDMLTGLQVGADDYLTKPFRPRELRARIAAMLRRPRSEAVAGADPQRRPDALPTAAAPPAAPAATSPASPPPRATARPGLLRHNGLVLDPGGRNVTVDGHAVELTRMEFDLLHTLLRADGTVVSKSGLVRALRHERPGSDSFVSAADQHSVEFHLGNLRRKIGENSRSPRWVQTVRGVGYRLTRESPGH
ncbi:response regulator transcription factor [Citricoccus sp. GCM10030269]|uniref:response regulator transcription factor n=1 Tax=Citricoccus sp. GCM10030269 TaxID=3273388 RepID=UPI0036065F5E